jgi:AcrR family transcriptional regulator
MAIEDHLSRRERKKRDTHQRLMETAVRLFREQGYDATTVEQIAEAADVAKGTFFNYFETKEAILPALVEWHLKQVEEALLPERGAPVSPVARIKLLLGLVAQDPLSQPAMVQRLFAAGMHHQQDVHPGRALTRLLAEQVRQAQAAGEICPDVDSFYAACVIRAMFFQQMMMWHCEYRPALLREMIDQMLNLLLDGIAGPNWRKSS